MNKAIIALVAIIIIGGGVYWYMSDGEKSPATETANTDISSAMRVEENMIVVTDQKPGNSVTASQVHLAAPGFIVIHEDTNGTPGAIIGSSALLSVGDSSQVKIALSRSVRDGEKLHAMLHNDTDGNGTFTASTDQSVQSRTGGPIEGWFQISSQASTNTPVSI